MRLLLPILLFLPCFTHAQAPKTVIVDALTKAPIPYIVITTEEGVLSADENGEIIKTQLENVTFKVVSDTYKAQVFDAGFSADTIFMEGEAQLLEETKIVENKASGESYPLGYHTQSTKVLPLYTFRVGTMNMLVTHITSDGKKSIIEKLFCKLQKIEKDSMYTCLLYTVGKDQKPAKMIFSYTLSGEDLKKKEPIDISNLDIKIPTEGIFVGVKSSGAISVKRVKKKFETQTSFMQYVKEDKLGNNKWFPVKDADYEDYISPPFGLQMQLK